jgi:hypothetical protein
MPPDENEDTDEDEDEENEAADGENYQRRAQRMMIKVVCNRGEVKQVCKNSKRSGTIRIGMIENNMQSGFGNNTSDVEKRMVACEEEFECNALETSQMQYRFEH